MLGSRLSAFLTKVTLHGVFVLAHLMKTHIRDNGHIYIFSGLLEDYIEKDGINIFNALDDNTEDKNNIRHILYILWHTGQLY